ncbi:MAG: bifunctional demethylmenaquinone methyltransferase/2-methoxy-6-polyprenyl-1,4-benzoquinol methylase UbiE [Spirochaetes bacterium]|nr:bifunctional demethylmenaquinone methyltransferase/2-methoxy-6-polyprenyl-1,4-benzoquinol methylase UbiE [Spirochaetota bacterium]
MKKNNIKSQQPADKKAGRHLHKIFTSVPSSYDIINHLITLFMDVRWRNKAVRECLSSNPDSILDICCGTGDMALTAAKLSGKKLQVTGLDFSQPMLDAAVKKAEAAGYNIKFIAGDVSDIPFPDETFDSICIGFGFRNLTYKNPGSEKHLSEILRVLKTGGKFVIAESSQPVSRFIKFFHRVYVRYFVFPAGYLVSRNRQAYKYLAVSVEKYYDAEELKELLLNAGFSRADFKRQFFGAAAIHIAVK